MILIRKSQGKPDKRILKRLLSRELLNTPGFTVSVCIKSILSRRFTSRCVEGPVHN